MTSPMKRSLSNYNLIPVLKIFLNITYWVIVLSALFFSFLLISTKKTTPFKLQAFTVNSGSMEPAIKTGSVVFVWPSNVYTKGDVITYTATANSDIVNSKTYTHRVVGYNKTLKGLITKGDANNATDSGVVTTKNIIGKVILTIPYLGYLVSFIQTQMGFILLVIFPLTLIVYHELSNIKKEISKLVAKYRPSKETITALRPFIFVLAGLIFSSLSVNTAAAFNFFDLESSSGNKIFAATLDIESSPDDDLLDTDENKLSAGDRISNNYILENNSKTDAKALLTVQNLSGDLCSNYLKLNVSALSSESGRSFILEEVGLRDFNDSDGEDLPDINVNEELNLFVELVLDEDAPLSVRNESCDFELEVKSWDSSHNNIAGFWDSEKVDNSIESGEWLGLSRKAVWHFQPLGQVGDEDVALTYYSYRFTNTNKFSPLGNRGFFIECFNNHNYNSRCGDGYTINAGTLRYNIYDETDDKWLCDTANNGQNPCSPSINVHNVNEDHVYKIVYSNGTATPLMQKHKYYMAVIVRNNNSENLQIVGLDEGDDSMYSNAQYNVTLSEAFSSAEENAQIDQFDMCINSYCGPFPATSLIEENDN